MAEISLRNKNLDFNEKVNYIINDRYIDVNKGEYEKLNHLRNMVKLCLKDINMPIVNKATGYMAIITGETIKKIIYPTAHFNAYSFKYINNLNAARSLDKLFESSVYIDSLLPMKGKEKKESEVGYHHFVAPLIMNSYRYRVFITAREKIESNILYVVTAEVLLEKISVNETNDISVDDLVDNIKLWNYDLEDYHIYNIDNIVRDNVMYETGYILETEFFILH